MPFFEQHCQEAAAQFGEPYAEVHQWLDEFADQPPYVMRHRKKRHHQVGIEEVRRIWGNLINFQKMSSIIRRRGCFEAS